MAQIETFGKISLCNADCMDVMREMPDNAFDLAIVDPPYGINASEMTMGSGKNKAFKKGKGWDSKPPDDDYFRELMRVSKNQIIWGGNYFRQLPPSKSWIVWDKGIDGETSFADGELAWTSFDRVLRIAKIRYKGFLGADKDFKRIHPTQKPVNLYGWLLNNYAEKGMRILDTHLGSGSICIAAHDMGFEMLGIELDPDYYVAARERLKYRQSQLTFNFE